MIRLTPFVFGSVFLTFALPVHAAEAQELAATNGGTSLSGRVAASSGQLLGIVTDASGVPLESTLISASGSAGTTIAVCGDDGRFEFRDLLPGTYLLRAHVSGFVSDRRHIVKIQSGRSTLHSISLHRTLTPLESSPVLLKAGFVPSLPGIEGLGQSEGDESDVVLTNDTDANGQYAVTPHDHSEKTWRLRRVRRSVLKEETSGLQLAGTREFLMPVEPATAVGLVTSSLDVSGGELTSRFPLSGQFHLLTRTTIESPASLRSVDVLPGQIAYVSLGAPIDAAGWGVRGAVTAGDSGSWVLAGSYVNQASLVHAVKLSMSYSRQHHSSGNVAMSLTPGESYSDQSREAGSIQVDGTWNPIRRVTVGYGAGIASYGYLEDKGLFSPRAQLTVEPIDRTRVRVAVSQNLLAPGAEEFLPPSSGVWLPPERTFAPLSPHHPLRVERARHVEVALEHEVSRSSTVGVRRFHQNVSDQMITMFGVAPYGPEPVSDHYYLTSANGVNIDGWGISVSHELAGRVQGAIDYRISRAEWAPWVATGLTPQTIGVFRTGTEQFHDVTTSVKTEIPETATRVFVLYRVNTAFAKAEAESLESGIAGRFALRVEQSLPFTPFGDSNWEVLVDVRSLFREQVLGASAYDELLVVSPPKQFVGGLIVHF